MNSTELKYEKDTNLLLTDMTDQEKYKRALLNYRESLLRTDSIRTISNGVFSTLKLIVVLITVLIICRVIIKFRIKQEQLKSTKSGSSRELLFFNSAIIFLICTMICKEILDLRRINREKQVKPLIIQITPATVIPRAIVEPPLIQKFFNLIIRNSDKIATFLYVIIRLGWLSANKKLPFRAGLAIGSMGLIFSENKLVWVLIILCECFYYCYSEVTMDMIVGTAITPITSGFSGLRGAVVPTITSGFSGASSFMGNRLRRLITRRTASTPSASPIAASDSAPVARGWLRYWRNTSVAEPPLEVIPDSGIEDAPDQGGAGLAIGVEDGGQEADWVRVDQDPTDSQDEAAFLDAADGDADGDA